MEEQRIVYVIGGSSWMNEYGAFYERGDGQVMMAVTDDLGGEYVPVDYDRLVGREPRDEAVREFDYIDGSANPLDSSALATIFSAQGET
jgi:hypothetical protein